MTDKLNDRPLPSLAQWLGDGDRTDGFAEWVLQNLVLSEAADQAGDPREAATIRIINTLDIATHEILRLECERHGREWADSAYLLARCAGVTVMGAILSGVDGERNPPLLKVARDFAREFEHGARTMAQSALKHMAKGAR